MAFGGLLVTFAWLSVGFWSAIGGLVAGGLKVALVRVRGDARNGLLNPCARLLVGLARAAVSFFLSLFLAGGGCASV